MAGLDIFFLAVGIALETATVATLYACIEIGRQY